MKTEKIRVNACGDGMEQALNQTEKAGLHCGLTKKEVLRLRLLSEELFGLLRTIAGEAEAVYWVESRQKSFSLHLRTELAMTRRTYMELIDVSTDGKNAAATGLMGNIKNMITVTLLPHEPKPSQNIYGMIRHDEDENDQVGSYSWSMKRYLAELERNSEQDGDAAYTLRELEKSIVANLSDEVTVRVVGSCAEITIDKAF